MCRSLKGRGSRSSARFWSDMSLLVVRRATDESVSAPPLSHNVVVAPECQPVRSVSLRGWWEELPLRRPGWIYRELSRAGLVSTDKTTSRAWSAGEPRLAARGELVALVCFLRLGGALRGQVSERPLDLAPDAADGDAEDTLATLEEVDDLVVAGALVDAGAVTHQGDAGQVVGAASAQVGDGGADLLERDAGVQQALDDLEDQDVAEAVEALGAGAGGATHGRLDQAGAGPVVELAVGDAGCVARGGPAVAEVVGQRRDVVVEEQALLVGVVRCVQRRLVVVRLVLDRHCYLRSSSTDRNPWEGWRVSVGAEYQPWSYSEDSSKVDPCSRVGKERRGVSLNLKVSLEGEGTRPSHSWVTPGPRRSPRARRGRGTHGTAPPRPPARRVRRSPRRRAAPRSTRSAILCAAPTRSSPTGGR